jgi:hypothetical protein
MKAIVFQRLVFINLSTHMSTIKLQTTQASRMQQYKSSQKQAVKRVKLTQQSVAFKNCNNIKYNKHPKSICGL